MCSSCGTRFEAIEGVLGLSAHAGIHIVHDHLEFR